MNHIKNTMTAETAARQQQTMKTQQKEEAAKMLAREFAELLCNAQDGRAHWTGSTADLMEAAHIAYEQGVMRKGDGNPCTFSEIAATACQRLHTRLPHNPRSRAAKAAQRKGIRQTPLADRYRRLATAEETGKPLLHMVAFD